MGAAQEIDALAVEPAPVDGTPDTWAAVERVVAAFAETAAERDAAGGTAKRERDLLRESGLLRLAIPAAEGGLGAPWSETLRVVRRIANVDSSLAHLFAFHHLMMSTLRLFGAPEQARHFWQRTAREGWFWGNALNPLDQRAKLTRTGAGYRLDGDKSFCSGAKDSDRLIVSGIDLETGKLGVAAIPTDRAGIVIHDDWDNMGQRQTDSGTVSFNGVFIADDEFLRDPGPMGSPFASLRPVLAQLILCNLYVGLAEGALEQARGYLHTLPADAFERLGDDPFILRRFGDLWVRVAGARALVEQAQAAFDMAWEQGPRTDPPLRGEVAVAVATAKVASSRAAVEVTSEIFEVMGARATAARHRFDRFWRNARTHTLHDPLDVKLRELGVWALHGEVPTPSFYS